MANQLFDEYQILNLLKKYGYLKQAENAFLSFNEPVEGSATAIQSYQRFYHLEETGILDEETISRLLSPRCGVADPVDSSSSDSFLSVTRGRWTKTNLTYQFLNFDTNLSQSEIRDAFIQACNIWSGYSPLVFQETSDGQADIRIGFYQGHHGNHPDCSGFNASDYAHAFFPIQYPGYPGLAGDMHFNKDISWVVDPPTSDDEKDFITVAAHELGHVLGLDHVGLSDALMHAHCQMPHRYLYDDDISGIQGLYGSLS